MEVCSKAAAEGVPAVPLGKRFVPLEKMPLWFVLGTIIWEYDTNREFQTLNGVRANGASVIGPADGCWRNALLELRIRGPRRSDGKCAARVWRRLAVGRLRIGEGSRPKSVAHATRSNNAAAPCPPPTHIVTTP